MLVISVLCDMQSRHLFFLFSYLNLNFEHSFIINQKTIVMRKQIIVMLCLFGFLIQPLMCETCSSRYIHLHGTQSSTAKDRPKLVSSLPIRVEVHRQKMNIYLKQKFKYVHITISDGNDRKQINEDIVCDDPFYCIDLEDLANGKYTIKLVLLNDILVGDFTL